MITNLGFFVFHFIIITYPHLKFSYAERKSFKDQSSKIWVTSTQKKLSAGIFNPKYQNITVTWPFLERRPYSTLKFNWPGKKILNHGQEHHPNAFPNYSLARSGSWKDLARLSEASSGQEIPLLYPGPNENHGIPICGMYRRLAWNRSDCKTENHCSLSIC